MQMERATWGSVKATIARVLNMCDSAEETRPLEYTNRAIQRLVEEGNWVGTIGRYHFCASNGCIVLPRQLETVLAAAICRTPITIRSGWYEFLGNGTYLQDGGSCSDGWGCGSNQLIDRDEVASFDNVIGSNKKLAVYCNVTEEADAYITLQYYDNNGQWVRTQVDGEWIDGERVEFGASGGYVLTTKFCMANGYIRAIKPVTKGTVRLYEYDTVNSTYRPLAYYEPDETIPVYRRMVVPGIRVSDSEECAQRSITLVAKKRFIPVRNDNDFLLISHPEALRMAVQSIWKSENNLPGEAALYMYGGVDPVSRLRVEGAVPILQKQLNNYRGAGTVTPMRMVNASTFGAGGVEALI